MGITGTIDFKVYTGTKTILAMPMGAGEAKRHGANITDEVINKNLGNNGYLIKYPDGYRSWSPAKQFEAAYRLSETCLDRLCIELEDVHARINRANEMLYNLAGDTPLGGRNLLEMQLKAMHFYAEVLVKRIQAIRAELARNNEKVRNCMTEGGEQ